MRLTPEGRERADSAAADRPTLPPQTLDPRDSAFAAERRSVAAAVPIDPVIGELRTSGLSLAERAARDAATKIIGLAVRGAVDEQSAPDWSARFGLEEIAAAALAEPIVRVGRPSALTDGELSVEFRILGDDEEIRGELVMEMAEGRWYTSGVQLVTLPRVSGSIEPGIDAPGTVW